MAGPFSNGGGGGSRDPDKIIAEAFEAFRSRTPRGWIGTAAVVVGLVLWAATGLYQVNPSEVGIVMRFGRVVATTPPGLHWHLPWPVETVFKPPVTLVLKEEIGFRTIDVGPPARYREVTEESRMLTADGNIVDLDFIVQYRIQDPIKFLFRVRDATETLRDSAESAMREVIGRSTIDDALTEGKLQIQEEAEQLLQEILDHYESGLQVTTVKLQDVGPPAPVQDAFKDVISAEQDRERMINEAEGVANDILPKARGMAAQIVNEAEGYAASVVKEAEGAAKRFELVYAAYAKAPEVTRKRLYLDAMEATLATADKIVVDDSVSDKIVPFLPLQSAIELPRAAAGADTKAAAKETSK